MEICGKVLNVSLMNCDFIEIRTQYYVLEKLDRGTIWRYNSSESVNQKNKLPLVKIHIALGTEINAAPFKFSKFRYWLGFKPKWLIALYLFFKLQLYGIIIGTICASFIWLGFKSNELLGSLGLIFYLSWLFLFLPIYWLVRKS